MRRSPPHPTLSLEGRGKFFYEALGSYWFLKKYEESTAVYEKFKLEDFTLDQYRSLLSAAVSDDPMTPSTALVYSAYREYKISPNTPRMNYLYPILFSPRVLSQVLKYSCWNSDYVLLDVIPSELWGNADFVRQLHLRPDHFKRKVAPSLRDNEPFMSSLISENALYLPYASERLLDKKDFLMNLPLESLESNEANRHREGLIVYQLPQKVRDDFEFMVKLCTHSPVNLSYVSPRLRNDVSFWKAIIQSSASLDSPRHDTIFIPDQITNPEVALLILQATHLSAEHLRGALSGLLDDRPTVLKLVERNGRSLSVASERLRNDKEVVIWAVKHSDVAFEFASDALKDDQNFVKELIKDTPAVFQFASERLRSDQDIAKMAVQKLPDMIKFVAGPLVGNEELAVLAMEGASPDTFIDLPEWVKTNRKAALVYQERVSH